MTGINLFRRDAIEFFVGPPVRQVSRAEVPDEGLGGLQGAEVSEEEQGGLQGAGVTEEELGGLQGAGVPEEELGGLQGATSWMVPGEWKVPGRRFRDKFR